MPDEDVLLPPPHISYTDFSNQEMNFEGATVPTYETRPRFGGKVGPNERVHIEIDGTEQSVNHYGRLGEGGVWEYTHSSPLENGEHDFRMWMENVSTGQSSDVYEWSNEVDADDVSREYQMKRNHLWTSEDGPRSQWLEDGLEAVRNGELPPEPPAIYPQDVGMGTKFGAETDWPPAMQEALDEEAAGLAGDAEALAEETVEGEGSGEITGGGEQRGVPPSPVSAGGGGSGAEETPPEPGGSGGGGGAPPTPPAAQPGGGQPGGGEATPPAQPPAGQPQPLIVGLEKGNTGFVNQ